MILPIFMLVVLAIMDFSRFYWTQSVVRGAAYEGVRMAILEEVSNIQVESTIIGELTNGGITQTASVDVGPREPQQPVDVTVSVPFEFLAIDSFVPVFSSVNKVTATAVMTHER